jgi:hypothetical protein
MRRVLPFAAAFALAGCQAAAPPPTPTTVPEAPSYAVAPPGTTAATNVALVRKGQFVTVGMTADEAFRIFRDPREGGFEDERLPPGFSAPYRARSWEGGPRGFGVITFRDQVVAAMYQEDRASYDRALELVQVHQERMGRPADETFAGKRTNYWFWEQDRQRLMILAFQTGGPEGVKITAAMGDAVVLDALGISAKQAREETPQVDRILSDRDASKNSTNF